MKKVISEQTKRILEIMSRMSDQGIITELNVKYLDQLLDKISSEGMESLSDYEKDALQKLSNDEDTNPPEVHSLDQTQETLRFTAQNMETGEPLVSPEDNGKTYGETKFKNAYIQGEAEQMAGYDLPVFIDGDLSQLDKPEDEQQIRMLLPDGEYECVARTVDAGGVEVDGYMLTLKGGEDDDSLAGLNEFNLGEIEDYNINNLGEPPEDLRNYEMGEQHITELEVMGVEESFNIKDSVLAEKLQAALDMQEWSLVSEVLEDLTARVEDESNTIESPIDNDVNSADNEPSDMDDDMLGYKI